MATTIILVCCYGNGGEVLLLWESGKDTPGVYITMVTVIMYC